MYEVLTFKFSRFFTMLILYFNIVKFLNLLSYVQMIYLLLSFIPLLGISYHFILIRNKYNINLTYLLASLLTDCLTD